MAEPLARVDPVPAAPLALAGVTLALVAEVRRYSLRGAAAALARLTAVPLPTRIGDAVIAGEDIAVMLGPNEWLLLGAVSSDGAGQPVSIVDVSERQTGFRLDGPAAAEILMSGCPLDLDRMAAGRGTRTLYETVEIIVVKLGAQSFHVEVWRSFAPWLWAALCQAASDGETSAR